MYESKHRTNAQQAVIDSLPDFQNQLETLVLKFRDTANSAYVKLPAKNEKGESVLVWCNNEMSSIVHLCDELRKTLKRI